MNKWLSFPKRHGGIEADKRMARVDIVGRVMLFCINVFVLLAAATSEVSLPRLMADSGLLGQMPIVLLKISALLLGMDLLINDIPHRLSIPVIARNRHWIYFWTGYCFLMPSFTAATAGMHKPAATFLYVSMAGAAWWLGFRHALAVRRGAKCAT